MGIEDGTASHRGREAMLGLGSLAAYLAFSLAGLVALNLVVVAILLAQRIDLAALADSGATPDELVQRIQRDLAGLDAASIELPAGLLALSSVFQFAGMILGAVVMLAIGARLRSRWNPSDPGGVVAGLALHGAPGGVWLAAAIGGITVGWVPGWIAARLQEHFPWLGLGALEMIQKVLTDGPLGGRIAMAVVVALFGPIAEEVVFRGFMWDALKRFLPPAVVWVVTSVIFAAYHMDPIHVMPVVITGLFLGLMRWTSGSLWPGVLVHVLNNGLGVAAAFGGVGEAPGWAVAISGLVTLGVSALAWKSRVRQD